MDHKSPGSGRVEITGECQSIGLPAEVDGRTAEIGAESRCTRFSRPARFHTNENQTKFPGSSDGSRIHEGGLSMIYVRGGADTMGE